jgi:hypothetical protein
VKPVVPVTVPVVLTNVRAELPVNVPTLLKNAIVPVGPIELPPPIEGNALHSFTPFPILN